MTQRKNFDRCYKLHAACAVKETQPELAYISFRQGYAYACNGELAVKGLLKHISTFNEEELAILEGKSIHMDNFRRLLNYNVANITPRGFEVNENGKRLLIYFNEQQEICFGEEVDDVLLKCCITNNIVSAHRVGFRASQMRIASQVMGTDAMKAEYFDRGDGNLCTYIVQLPVKAYIGVLIFHDLLCSD